MDSPLPVGAGRSCRIAARAKAVNGTTAHTTPVYIVRNGLRYWRFDGLNGLIAKRLRARTTHSGQVDSSQNR